MKLIVKVEMLLGKYIKMYDAVKIVLENRKLQIMITKEVRAWLKKLEISNYSEAEALKDLAEFSKYLSREDLIFLRDKIKEIY